MSNSQQRFDEAMNRLVSPDHRSPLRSERDPTPLRWKFKLQKKGYRSPLDLPMGTVYEPPSRFDIVVGDVENVCFMLPLAAWIHIVFIGAILMAVLWREWFAMMVLGVALIVGITVGLAMHGKTGVVETPSRPPSSTPRPVRETDPFAPKIAQPDFWTRGAERREVYPPRDQQLY